MGEIKILKEEPVSLSELKNKLDIIKKRDKEFSFRGTKTEEYLNSLKILKKKEGGVFIKKLKESDIPRLNDKYIKKILDIMPKDMDSLKLVLSNEDISLKQEELEKILIVLK